MHILVTGATGYIGGRLIPRLLEAGHRVRVLVRDAERVQRRAWVGEVEVCVGDLEHGTGLEAACRDIEVAYYLVHSLNQGPTFAQCDRRAARNFVQAARHISHTIYLGGLLPEGPHVSPHLKSRAEAGAILRESLPVTELRAGPIIGSGSASFEMVRYLTERHPLMIVPACIDNLVQPIAVRDILSYLLAAPLHEALGVVEVGGEQLSFRDLMLVYAEVRGLKRRIVGLSGLPVAPRVVAWWAGGVTPIPRRLAGPLISGMIHPVIADTRRSREIFPEISPMTYRRAVELALQRIRLGHIETRWTGAGGKITPFLHLDREGVIREVRTQRFAATPEDLYRAFSTLGGDRGWLFWDVLWRIRGAIDQLAGGPGLRRGRRHPQELFVGETVDFWRVERAEPPAILRLRAEMKLPGRAWLWWETWPENGKTRLVQTAAFLPNGLGGILYWYMLYPIHKVVFSRLIRAIGREAEKASSQNQANKETTPAG